MGVQAIGGLHVSPTEQWFSVMIQWNFETDVMKGEPEGGYLVFAVREVPQDEYTGYPLFRLLYGRYLQGILEMLKD